MQIIWRIKKIEKSLCDHSAEFSWFPAKFYAIITYINDGTIVHGIGIILDNNSPNDIQLTTINSLEWRIVKKDAKIQKYSQ